MNCEDCIHNEVCHMREVYNDIEEQIKELGCMDFIARADVQEIKHGEWIETQEPLGWCDVDCAECSVCHESWIIDEDSSIEDYECMWHYCPNCGAKMDGGKNDDSKKSVRASE